MRHEGAMIDGSFGPLLFGVLVLDYTLAWWFGCLQSWMSAYSDGKSMMFTATFLEMTRNWKSNARLCPTVE